MALLWGGVAPFFLPGHSQRLTTLLGFFPIELVGVLGPALLFLKVTKSDPKEVFPTRRVPLSQLLLIVGATFGLALVITYLQGWFAHWTGMPYPKEIGALIRARSPLDWLVLVLAVALVPAVSEELVTRGYIQSALVPACGLSGGILLTAFTFALLHLTPAGIPTYVVLGVWLSWLRYRTGSLWGNMAAHATNNVLAILQANLVSDAFWGPNLYWVLPSGGLIFALLGYLATFRSHERSA